MKNLLDECIPQKVKYSLLETGCLTGQSAAFLAGEICLPVQSHGERQSRTGQRRPVFVRPLQAGCFHRL
jgi:hypothetical protein